MKKIKYNTPFHLISKEFKKANIPVLLIGGFAVNFYRVSRQTADIDFLIDKNDYNKVKEILVNAGYNETNFNEIFARFSNQSDQLHFLDIDIMFVDKRTIEQMLTEGINISIAKNKFTIPSLNHLFALKLHSIKHNPDREYKDLFDILSLLKNNKINVNTKEFKTLCLKFGTDKIYKKIIALS